MAVVMDDTVGPAVDAGYAPKWYLWNGINSHYYQHMKDDGWVRLVIWGGQGWAADRDGTSTSLGNYYYQEESPFARRTYRIEMQRGDTLRMKVGGRATKTGGSGGWESTGDHEDMLDGVCQVGGYPDGGDGLSQDLVLPAGANPGSYAMPSGSEVVTFRMNGSGGATRVWLRRDGGDEELIIVEPGEAGYVSNANVGWAYDKLRHISHWGSWTERVDFSGESPEFIDLGFAWDIPPLELLAFDNTIRHTISDLMINKSASNYVFDEARTYNPVNPLFDYDLLSLAAGRQGWFHARQFHGTDPTALPSSGELPRLPKDLETGRPPYWGQFIFSDGWQAPAGGETKGADSIYTSFGPTGSGGGGWGGGHGGNAQYMHRSPGDGSSTFTGVLYSISIGAFGGRAGGRWWHDDYVVHVDDGDIGIDDIWPDEQNYVYWPYVTTPWLMGFGAVWLCREVVEDDEYGWSVSHIRNGKISDTVGSIFE